MECYCYLRNIQDLLPDGKTPCERRFGVPFNGPVIPFGAIAERMGESLPNYHEDHSAGNGMISVSHYNLVHKFIPLPQAMKVPAAKAAVDKEWDKLEKIPAGQLTKVSNKKDVIDEARNKGRKVHFASLMDLCHLKNSELEPQFQKYKGRVVLRGDIAKNDSASFAVLTDQRSSASQMSLPKQKWPKSWPSMEEPVVPLERKLYGHPLPGLLWERKFEKVLLEHGWVNAYSLTEKKDYSCLCMWMI